MGKCEIVGLKPCPSCLGLSRKFGYAPILEYRIKKSVGFNENMWFCCNVLKKSSDADRHGLTVNNLKDQKLGRPW